MANTKKTVDDVKNPVDLNEAAEAKTGDAKETEAVKPVDNSAKSKSETSKDIDAISNVINSMAREDIAAEEVGEKVKPDNNKEIPVKSVTFGGLTWISGKTNSHYRWNEIGAVEYIPFGELVYMNNSSRDFLFDPLVILLDEQAAKYFRLDAVYKNFACVNELENLFAEGDLEKIESALNKIKMTKMRNVAISKVRSLYDDGVLTNIRIIKLVEKILCFDFNDFKSADDR